MKSIRLALLLSAMLGGCDFPDAMKDPDNATIRVMNLMSDTIAGVYMAPCTSEAMGAEDSLQLRETLIKDQYRSFRMQPDCYDLNFRDIRDSLVDARTHISVGAGDTALILLQRPAPPAEGE